MDIAKYAHNDFSSIMLFDFVIAFTSHKNVSIVLVGLYLKFVQLITDRQIFDTNGNYLTYRSADLGQ